MIPSPFVLESFIQEGKYFPYWLGHRSGKFGCGKGNIWCKTKYFLGRKFEDWDQNNYSQDYKHYLLRLREYEVECSNLNRLYWCLAPHERKRISNALPTEPMELFADGLVIRNWLATLGRGESYWS